jgi:hypothetical protein
MIPKEETHQWNAVGFLYSVPLQFDQAGKLPRFKISEENGDRNESGPHPTRAANLPSGGIHVKAIFALFLGLCAIKPTPGGDGRRRGLEASRPIWLKLRFKNLKSNGF